MCRIQLTLMLLVLSLLILNLANLTPPLAQAATAPGYRYVDYSRADWGANPAYDARYQLTAAANTSFQVNSTDLDNYEAYHPIIQPGQVIYSPKLAQTPTGIAIHDTVTSNSGGCDVATSAATLRSIQEYHAVAAYSHVPFGVGYPDPHHEADNRGVVDSTFGDIGYHFLIDCAGHIFEGRAGGIFLEGSHIHRHNRGLIGIALMGDFGSQPPAPAQRAALLKLVTRLCRDLHINPVGVWHQALLNGDSETLTKNGKPVLNVAGHIDYPDNDHTDPGVLDLHALRQDITAGLTNGEGQTFKETGQTLAEPFRNFWETNGGLAIFGFPITPTFQEINPADHKSYEVQYFERARFELHPELINTPYYIQLGRLGVNGAELAKTKIPQPFYNVPALPSNLADPVYYFPESSHTLRHGFLAYWIANGGLAIFGLPLGEEFGETDGQGHTYTVQYFERARFEYHPELAPPYQILLGRLGADNKPK